MNLGGGRIAPAATGSGLFGGMFGGRNNNAKANQLGLERQRQEELIKEQLRALEIDMEEEKRRQEELVQETVKRQEAEQEAKRLEEEQARKLQEEEAARKKAEDLARRREARRLRREKAALKRQEDAAAATAQNKVEAITEESSKQSPPTTEENTNLQTETQSTVTPPPRSKIESPGGDQQVQSTAENKIQPQHVETPKRISDDSANNNLQENDPEAKLVDDVTSQTIEPNQQAETGTKTTRRRRPRRPRPRPPSAPPDSTSTKVDASPPLQQPTSSPKQPVEQLPTTPETEQSKSQVDSATADTSQNQEPQKPEPESAEKQQLKMKLSSHIEKLQDDAAKHVTSRHGDEVSLGTLELNKQSQTAARARRARRPRSRATREADRPWGGVVSRMTTQHETPAPVPEEPAERDFFANSQRSIFEKSAFNFDFNNTNDEDETVQGEDTVDGSKDKSRVEPETDGKGGSSGMVDIDFDRLDNMLDDEEYKTIETKLSDQLTEKFENTWEEAQVDKKFVAELKLLRGDKVVKPSSSPNGKKKNTKVETTSVHEDVPRLYLFESEKRRDKKSKKKKKKKSKKERNDTTLTKEFKAAMKNFFEPEIEEEYTLGPGAFTSIPIDGFGDTSPCDSSDESSVSISSVESMGGFIKELREKSLKQQSGTDDERSARSRKSDRSRRSRKSSRNRGSSHGGSPSSRSTSPADRSVASSRRYRGRSPSSHSVASKRSVYTSGSANRSTRSGQLPPLAKVSSSTPPLTRGGRRARSSSASRKSGSRHRHRRLSVGGQSTNEDEKSAVSRARTEASRRRLPPSSGTSLASSRRSGTRSVRSVPAHTLMDPAEFYAREVKKQQSAKMYSTDGIRKELEDMKRQSSPVRTPIAPKLRPPKPHPSNKDTKHAKAAAGVIQADGADAFSKFAASTAMNTYPAPSPANQTFGLGASSDFSDFEPPGGGSDDNKKGIFGKVAATTLIVSRFKAAAARAKQKTELGPAAGDETEVGLLSP